MSGIVMELQKELLDDNIKLSSSLNKAYVIARKLNIPDLLDFLNCEIRGYPDANNLPSYRITNGVLKGFNPYQGWQSLVIEDDKFAKTMSVVNLTMSIAEIESLVDDKDNTSQPRQVLPSSLIPKMIGEGFCTQLALFFGSNVLSAVLSTVRHAMLEWTLKLEENGIVGEGLSFTDKEKEIAKASPQIINITLGNESKVNVLSTDNSSNVNNGK